VGSRSVAISTGMIAGDGISPRGEIFKNKIIFEYIDISGVSRDLRPGRSPQVAAEGVGRGGWTLTGERTRAKNGSSRRRDRGRFPAGGSTAVWLGVSAGRPPVGRRVPPLRREENRYRLKPRTPITRPRM